MFKGVDITLPVFTVLIFVILLILIYYAYYFFKRRLKTEKVIIAHNGLDCCIFTTGDDQELQAGHKGDRQGGADKKATRFNDKSFDDDRDISDHRSGGKKFYRKIEHGDFADDVKIKPPVDWTFYSSESKKVPEHIHNRYFRSKIFFNAAGKRQSENFLKTEFEKEFLELPAELLNEKSSMADFVKWLRDRKSDNIPNVSDRKVGEGIMAFRPDWIDFNHRFDVSWSEDNDFWSNLQREFPHFNPLNDKKSFKHFLTKSPIVDVLQFFVVNDWVSWTPGHEIDKDEIDSEDPKNFTLTYVKSFEGRGSFIATLLGKVRKDFYYYLQQFVKPPMPKTFKLRGTSVLATRLGTKRKEWGDEDDDQTEESDPDEFGCETCKNLYLNRKIHVCGHFECPHKLEHPWISTIIHEDQFDEIPNKRHYYGCTNMSNPSDVANDLFFYAVMSHHLKTMNVSKDVMCPNQKDGKECPVMDKCGYLHRKKYDFSKGVPKNKVESAMPNSPVHLIKPIQDVTYRLMTPLGNLIHGAIFLRNTLVFTKHGPSEHKLDWDTDSVVALDQNDRPYIIKLSDCKEYETNGRDNLMVVKFPLSGVKSVNVSTPVSGARSSLFVYRNKDKSSFACSPGIIHESNGEWRYDCHSDFGCCSGGVFSTENKLVGFHVSGGSNYNTFLPITDAFIRFLDGLFVKKTVVVDPPVNTVVESTIKENVLSGKVKQQGVIFNWKGFSKSFKTFDEKQKFLQTFKGDGFDYDSYKSYQNKTYQDKLNAKATKKKEVQRKSSDEIKRWQEVNTKRATTLGNPEEYSRKLSSTHDSQKSYKEAAEYLNSQPRPVVQNVSKEQSTGTPNGSLSLQEEKE
jgi:hypothetical protein